MVLSSLGKQWHIEKWKGKKRLKQLKIFLDFSYKLIQMLIYDFFCIYYDGTVILIFFFYHDFVSIQGIFFSFHVFIKFLISSCLWSC